MKKYLKNAAAIFLSLAVMLSFTPFVGDLTGGGVGATQAWADFPSDIKVGFIDAGGTHHSVTLDGSAPYFINGQATPVPCVSGDDYNAYYDVNNRCLYLRDYDGTAIDEREGFEKLTIVLYGDNKINSDTFCGISVNKDLEITSNSGGKLTIKCKPSDNDAGAVLAGDDIVISGDAILDIDAETTDTVRTSDARGLYTNGGSIKIIGSADVNVYCKEVRENGNSYGISANEDIVISTSKPISITVISTGYGGTSTGLYSNDDISISNTPKISLDLTSDSNDPYYPIEKLEACMDRDDYHGLKVENGNNTKYTIEPKYTVPETIDIQFDASQVLPLTTEMTGKSVNESFPDSIQSPKGTSYPSGATEGWYVRLSNLTGFGVDSPDWQFMRESTEPLVAGNDYFLYFDVGLENINYKWNTGQEFTVNGVYNYENYVEFNQYEDSGRYYYKVRLRVAIPTDISDGILDLVPEEFTYDGSYLKPTVSVSKGGVLEEGLDFDTTFSNNKNVGEATVTVTGKLLYDGTLTGHFKINPKGTTLKKPKRAKKAITVKWNKRSTKMSKQRISGYKIMLATDSDFTQNVKNVTVKGYKKTSKKVKKLKSKKKYYIKIRTYMKVKGVTYYSPWSSVRTAKTK